MGRYERDGVSQPFEKKGGRGIPTKKGFHTLWGKFLGQGKEVEIVNIGSNSLEKIGARVYNC